jgi:hypothetical protein
VEAAEDDHSLGLDDTIIEPTHKDTVRYVLRSSSATYNGIAAQHTPVTITDNDGDTDLQFIVQNAPASTPVGSVFEVVYRVTNHGPTLSTGATLTVDPQGASNVVFQQAFGATCSVDGAGVLTCSVAGQAAGTQITVALVFQANGAGDVPFEAVVVGQQPDADPTNDQASVTVAVN